MEKKPPIITNTKGGAAVSIVGDSYKTLISGEDTGGAFAVIDMLISPGGGPGPHAHAAMEESFYVVDGEIEVKSEFGTYIAGKGTFINIPKGGVVHSFKNKTENMAHMICYVVPSGLEAFFKEVGIPVEHGQFPPSPPLDEEAIKKLMGIAQKYGQEFYPPDFLG